MKIHFSKNSNDKEMISMMEKPAENLKCVCEKKEKCSLLCVFVCRVGGGDLAANGCSYRSHAAAGVRDRGAVHACHSGCLFTAFFPFLALSPSLCSSGLRFMEAGKQNKDKR